MNLFGILSPRASSNYRPSAPFLYEVASHDKNCHFGDYYYYYYYYNSYYYCFADLLASMINKIIYIVLDRGLSI